MTDTTLIRPFHLPEEPEPAAAAPEPVEAPSAPAEPTGRPTIALPPHAAAAARADHLRAAAGAQLDPEHAAVYDDAARGWDTVALNAHYAALARRARADRP